MTNPVPPPTKPGAYLMRTSENDLWQKVKVRNFRGLLLMVDRGNGDDVSMALLMKVHPKTQWEKIND